MNAFLISFVLVQILSSAGIVLLFQAEEAQRKLKRQNREDTGIYFCEETGEEGITYQAVYCPDIQTNSLFQG